MKIITKKEMEVLEQVESSDLNDGTQDILYGSVWYDLNDMGVFRGVISSLVKKQIIKVEEEDKCFGEGQTEIIINSNYYKKCSEGYFELTNLKVK